MGGQTALNLAVALAESGCELRRLDASKFGSVGGRDRNLGGKRGIGYGGLRKILLGLGGSWVVVVLKNRG